MSKPSNPARWRVLALSGVLVLVAAACGTADVADTTEAPAVTEAPEATDPPEEAEPSSLRFGVTPADDAAGQEERFGSMVQALEEDLGMDVEFFTATSYAGFIESLITGDLDLVVMSPFAYVIATGEGADIEARAAYISSPDAAPVYQSFGLARADNDEVNDISDFADKRICFVEPGSASGFLVPSAGLLDIGLDPEDDVAEAIFAGAHDNSVLAIQDGSCEAGFAVDSMLPRLEATGDVGPGELKIVWESPEIPGVVLAISRNLPESLRDSIAEVFLANNGEVLYDRGFCHSDWVEEEGPTGAPFCPVAGVNTWGFAGVDDALYDSLRQICELTQAPACFDPEA